MIPRSIEHDEKSHSSYSFD